jgi:3-oxoadipate enol-lactonase
METSIELHHQVIGSGIPMVLIHGYPLDHTIWYPVVDVLKESNIQMILPDLRGHGLSPVPDGIYTMDLMAEDILNLLNKLGIGKAILVGHSMGGYVSLAFSKRYPNRLAGLGLVSTQAFADTPEKRQARINSARDVMKRGSKAIGGSMPAKLTGRKEVMDKITEIITRTQPRGIAGALKGMAERPDMTEWLSSISAPAVVIHGMQDILMPLENSLLMSRLLGKAWLVKIADAWHMPMMETPEVVAQTLSELALKASYK